MATSRARPALASQAEKAKSSIGAVEKAITSSCRAQRARAINRDNIIPSRHSRAERR